MPFRFDIEPLGGDLILCVSGRLCQETFDEFRSALSRAQARGIRLIVDVEDVSTVDSCGLGMLLIAKEETHADAVSIRGASPELRRILATVNFGQLFEIE